MPTYSVGASYFSFFGYPKTSIEKGHKDVLTLFLCPGLRILLSLLFFPF